MYVLICTSVHTVLFKMREKLSHHAAKYLLPLFLPVDQLALRTTMGIRWGVAISFLFALGFFPRALALSLSDKITCRRNVVDAIGMTTTVTVVATMTVRPSTSRALTPEEAATQYDTYAATYDQLDGGAASNLLGIEDARRHLMRQARGKVLEIGVGTGLNLDKYAGEQIESLTLVDISDGMLREAAARVKTLPNLRGVPVTMLKADATKELAARFGSSSSTDQPMMFDTVVDAFSLCVMGNEGARKCLDQMASVVQKQPTGRVLLLENCRSSNPVLGLYQDATAEAAASAGGKGCVYNQDVRAMILATGRLEILQETPYAEGLFRSFVCAPK